MIFSITYFPNGLFLHNSFITTIISFTALSEPYPSKCVIHTAPQPAKIQIWNILVISSVFFCVRVCLFVCLMVLNPTFNNISVISWQSVLLVEETGGPWENHLPVVSLRQTLSHDVVHLTMIKIRTHNISVDRQWLHR